MILEAELKVSTSRLHTRLQLRLLENCERVACRIYSLEVKAEIPSYAVRGTPFMMASQAKSWSSETGPIETRNGAGSCVCDRSSWRSRFVDGGVGGRDFDAILAWISLGDHSNQALRNQAFFKCGDDVVLGVDDCLKQDRGWSGSN